MVSHMDKNDNRNMPDSKSGQDGASWTAELPLSSKIIGAYLVENSDRPCTTCPPLNVLHPAPNFSWLASEQQVCGNAGTKHS